MIPHYYNGKDNASVARTLNAEAGWVKIILVRTKIMIILYRKR